MSKLDLPTLARRREAAANASAVNKRDRLLYQSVTDPSRYERGPQKSLLGALLIAIMQTLVMGVILLLLVIYAGIVARALGWAA